MIQAVLVDGVQVNNANTFLASVTDGASAPIDVSTYPRGGRSGVSLGIPFYRGMVISMEWFLKGNTYSELLSARDRLARMFRLQMDKTQSQTKRLTFVMVDGSSRECDAIFAPFNGSLSPKDTASAYIQVTALSQKEILHSTLEETTNVYVNNLGGFSVPFAIPFTMANNPSQLTAVINNAGNAEYYPTIRVHAPLDTFTISNATTGKSFSFDDSLTSSDYVDLDFYNRTAIKNGTTNVLADVSGTWWWLDPGSNTITLSTVSGNGYAVVTHRSAYRGI